MYSGYQQQTSHGTGSVSSFFNIPLPEHLSPKPIIVLNILFVIRVLFILTELSPKIMPYFTRELKYAKYTVLRVTICKTWNSFLNIRQTLLNLWSKYSIYVLR